MAIRHTKTNTIADPTQAELNAQIALGHYPPGTLLADITLASDWNANHTAPDITDVIGLQAALDLKAPLASPTFTGTVSGITAAMVGAPSGSGTSSGTNTGDQTSIAGITGTKAQFDTAVTDGNFLYVGDITQYTDELAQDAIGGMVDTSLIYVDATPLLQRAALTGDVTATAGSNATTIAAGVVTNTKLSNVATATIKGRVTAATGVPEDLTGTQATTLLNTFTSGLKGLAPSSGGGTTNFLRADGTWQVPSGGGGPSLGLTYMIATAQYYG